MKNYSLPYIPKESYSEIKKILDSGKINYWNGNVTKKFESEFAKYIGKKYSVATNSGTTALELCFRSIGIEENDEVITTPRSYISSATSISMQKATPVFCDIKKDTQNIDSSKIPQLITKKTKAILCVHLNGMPCDMEQIIKIKKKYNLLLVEDCSQAHGAQIKEKKIGSFGDISIFSFCNDKIITTGGEGGILLTNNYSFFKKAWSYKDIGRNLTRAKNEKKKNNNKYNKIYDDIGSNLRMTEIQSAIGLSFLKKLDKDIIYRNKKAMLLNSIIYSEKIIIPIFRQEIVHAFYRYNIFFLEDTQKISKIIYNINKKYPNISNYGSCPLIYEENIYKKHKYRKGNLKIAKNLKNKVISINIANLNLYEIQKLGKIINYELK